METRERIIQKAIDLFYKKGFVKGSIRDLVRALNMTNAAVYNHFKNKDDLLYVIINRMGTMYFDRMIPLSNKYDNPLDRLKGIIQEHIFLVLKNTKAVKVFFDDIGQLSPKLRSNILNQQREMYKLLKTQLNDLEKEGLLRPVNKTLATYCCFAMLNWSYRWFKKNKGLSVEEVSSGVTDIFLNGVLNTSRISEDKNNKTKTDRGKGR